MNIQRVTPRRLVSALMLCTMISAPAMFAQEQNPTAAPGPIVDKDGIYLYRVKVVQRDLDAVNYLHRSGFHRHCL